jgi:hypothetical protein
MATVKVIDRSQVFSINKYRNLRYKVLKCDASVYFKKQCIEKDLNPNCTKLNDKIPKHDQQEMQKLQIKEEIKFLHMKKEICVVLYRHYFIIKFTICSLQHNLYVTFKMLKIRCAEQNILCCLFDYMCTKEWIVSNSLIAHYCS